MAEGQAKVPERWDGPVGKVAPKDQLKLWARRTAKTKNSGKKKYTLAKGKLLPRNKLPLKAILKS